MMDEQPAGGRGASTGSVARTYAVPFSEVWEAVGSTTSGLKRWAVRTSDPREGTLSLTTTSLIGHRPLDAEVRLWLDDLGQTRLEIRFHEPKHLLIPAVGPRRAERFLRRLERALGIRGRR